MEIMGGQTNAFRRDLGFIFIAGTDLWEDSEETDFERSGLDAEELGFMKAAERRQGLEAAGLNPDEYDF